MILAPDRRNLVVWPSLVGLVCAWIDSLLAVPWPSLRGKVMAYATHTIFTPSRLRKAGAATSAPLFHNARTITEPACWAFLVSGGYHGRLGRRRRHVRAELLGNGRGPLTVQAHGPDSAANCLCGTAHLPSTRFPACPSMSSRPPGCYGAEPTTPSRRPAPTPSTIRRYQGRRQLSVQNRTRNGAAAIVLFWTDGKRTGR